MERQQLRFGPYVFDPAGRRLLRGGTELRLGSRALDLLAALLERPGEVVSHATLVSRAWPQSVVEETSLRVQMSALRRALGEGDAGTQHIATVSGRGYCFVAPVAALSDLPRADVPHAPSTALVRPIGREALVDALLRQLATVRLVCLVGPGGVGKSTVALAAAEQGRDRFAGGVTRLDLADCRDGADVARALQDVATAAPRAPRLLVLDTCEHVIEAAAEQVHALVARDAGLHVLATSREPLAVAGEHVQPVPALALPTDDADPGAVTAAMQLFIERACALDDALAFGPESHPLLAQLCRCLDGLPLAIELAAARADALSLHDLVQRVADPLPMLNRGRRTASARHRSLQACLDWGHALLSPLERTVLRRLSVLPGRFTLDAAADRLCTNDAAGLTRLQLVDSLVSLVTRSWLQAGSPAGDAEYQMLFTTRAYARMKLEEAGESGRFGLRAARPATGEVARETTV